MEKLIKSIPTISGLLFFLGFLNYSFYYNFFGIDIASFLTTGELLLSFLRLTIPLLIVCAFFSIYILIGVAGRIIRPETDQNEKSEEHEIGAIFINEHVRDFIKTIRKSNFRKISDYLYVLAELISVLSVLVHHIFLIGFPCYVYNEIVSSKPYFLSIELTIGIGVFWFLFFFGTLDKLEKRRSIEYNRVKILFVIVFFIASIYIANKDKAISVLQGDSYLTAKVYLKNDTILNDSNLVYIGKTDKYIFYRNLKDSSNVIYSINNIISLEMKK